MKLEGCFYQMLKEAQHPRSILNSIQDLSFRLRLLPDNDIFKAHFPRYPITPGAIQVRVATELLEKNLGSLSLRGISNLKFIAPIYPNDEVIYSFTNIKASDSTASATLEISANDDIRSKMFLEYAIV